MVTSKPKRISVADGVVHIMFLLVYKLYKMYTMSLLFNVNINYTDNHEKGLPIKVALTDITNLY